MYELTPKGIWNSAPTFIYVAITITTIIGLYINFKPDEYLESWRDTLFGRIVFAFGWAFALIAQFIAILKISFYTKSFSFPFRTNFIGGFRSYFVQIPFDRWLCYLLFYQFFVFLSLCLVIKYNRTVRQEQQRVDI